MVVTLYKIDASPPSRAVLMVIEALDIPDVEYVDINLFQQEHLKEDFVKLNPQHTVPTLVDDDFVLWDSHAITTYLINVYGENDSLYPSEPKQRALIDQRLHFDSGTLFPALADAVLTYLAQSMQDSRGPVRERAPGTEILIWKLRAQAPPPGRLSSHQHGNPNLRAADKEEYPDIDTAESQNVHVPIFYGGEKDFRPEALEKITKAYELAEKFLMTPWLAGDDVTIADICCVASVSSMNEILAIDEASYPKLSEWLNRCLVQKFYEGNEPGLTQFREVIQIRLG